VFLSVAVICIGLFYGVL